MNTTLPATLKMATHQTAPTLYTTSPSTSATYAYRRFGRPEGIPLLFLIHFRGTMDLWDPLLINTLAASRPVILFDNAGVGKSTGQAADTITGMAQHVLEFLKLIEVREVDVLGFSMGGYVAQMVALNGGGGVVQRLVLAGTGVSYGEDAEGHSLERQKEVGQIAGVPEPDYEGTFSKLFFYPSETSRAAGRAWCVRVHERDEATSGEPRSEVVSYRYADGGAGLKAMVAAGRAFGDPGRRSEGSYDRLHEIKVPVFVANGKEDFMIPTRHTWVLQQRLPDARAKVWPDSGHGFLYQFAEEFAGDVGRFLDGAV